MLVYSADYQTRMATVKKDERLLVNFSWGGVVNLPVYRDDLAKLLQWKNILVMGLVILVFIAVIIQTSKVAANEQCKSE